MSDRVEMGSVLTEAFNFAWQRLPTLIRYIWAPFLILIFLAGGLTAMAIDFDVVNARDGSANLDPEALTRMLKAGPVELLGYAMIFVVVSMFLFAGVYTSVYRLVALGEERSDIIQLYTDGPAMRTFIAMLISSLINLVVFLIAIGAAQAITGKSIMSAVPSIMEIFSLSAEAEMNGRQVEIPPDQMAKLGEGLVPLALGILLAIIPTVYVSVKLLPFAPATAVENRLALVKSFTMTFGHAWSIFGSIILFAIATFLLALIVELASGIIELFANLFQNMGGPMALVAILIAFIIMVAELIFQAFLINAQLALQAIIYRRIETGS
ncbi:MAG: hypothetical protein AAFR21_18120 [Pseudomonadota bacterium]